MNTQDYWIAADLIFDGAELLSGHAVRITDDHVTDIAPAPPSVKHHRGLITPAFVDLQVNGGGGVMLNTTPTADGMRAILAAHQSLGTGAILPTVITDTANVLDAATDAALACKADTNLLGLHIEGPHIALAKRGTHATAHIRPLDDHTLGCVSRLRAADIVVMITLAPEAVTLAQITALTAMGAIVSIGHTNAPAQSVRDAITAGASCGTHLFNAMSQMQARDAGAVGALIQSDCHLGVICDGHHVAGDMIALASCARPKPERMFLVSDAMATVGGPEQFDLYGQTITLQNGKLVNAEGNLAGAHVTQSKGIKRLVQNVGIDLTAALYMGLTTPANLIGRPDLATLIRRPISEIAVLSDTLDYLGQLSTMNPTQ